MAILSAKNQHVGMRVITSASHNTILYCARALGPIVAALAIIALPGIAQDSAPQIKPLESGARKKKDEGPRALGILQLSSNGKARLVPVAIMVGTKFYDASAYKADPVPMALDSGTVYEAERTGKSLGLFTVSAALHSNAVNSATPWIGTGSWLPAGTEPPRTAPKAEKVPIGIESDDGPPRLKKGAPQKSETGESKSDPAAQAPPEPKPAEPKPPSQTPPDAASKPAPGAKEPAQTQSSTESSDSSADPNNRPRLRRGRPTQPLPGDEDVPGYSRPGSRSSIANAASSVPKEDVADLVPAVSDADGPNPRSYAFDWLKGEEADRQKQMLDLAGEQIRVYLAKQAKASIDANQPAPKSAVKAGARRAAPKPPEPVFENVQMRTFDLWSNNQPIMIFRADAHVPNTAAKQNSQSTPDSSREYTITLVARTDIYNNLHKLYSSVTDKYHLDVTPRLDLIDAVDADGDGRGELLFRETSDAGTGYIIYRATADSLWKLFDSLNAE